MSDLTQANRLLSLKTPAGDDVLCIDRATIVERVSSLFVMQLEMRAKLKKASSVEPDALLGQMFTLTVELPDKKKRHFNGICNRFSVGHQDEDYAYYRAEVVPQFWLLTLTSDCKVFQNKTVPDILKDVLQGLNVEWKLPGAYKKLDYCVQYRETDFNFASRLMEQEGIFYYFKHSDGDHKLVIANKASDCPDCENLAQARFLPQAGMGEWQDGIHTLEPRRSMVPGKYALRDYHFQLSNQKLEGKAPSPVKVGNNASLEIYDYPGEYAQRFNKPDERLGEVGSHADEIAKWRIEEQAAAHLTISGTSTCRAFTTGHAFKILGKDEKPYSIPGTDGKYVLMSVKHTMVQAPDYENDVSPGRPYQNTFTCIPASVPYRPARSTPRPVVQGLQSAVVVGLSGEEIDCDKYGRVKVQFHWDREGKKDENSSCWVRVASMWAGKQWGMVNIPRIGQEVVVSFLEGDPDQPLIVGSVYNYDNMPPYELPANKTQSGIKSRSSKDGSDDNFNEIRFEDKKGSEQLFIHAEKNQDIEVENDETHWVGHDRKKTIDNDETTHVKRNRTETVDKDETITIHGNRTETVDKDEEITIGEKRTETVGKDESITIGGKQQVTVGKSCTISAADEILLKCGAGSISIKKDGTIAIKGMNISIKGSGKVDVKGTLVKLSGDGIAELKGGLVMVN